MKRSALLLVVALLVSGCSSQKVWVLKKTETAIMDYAAIVPMRNPDGKTVAKIYGTFEDRRYEVPMEQQFLNAYVKKLLSGHGNQLYVHDGVLVIRNAEGGKIRVGGDGFYDSPDLGLSEFSTETRGGVFLGQPEQSKGLITTLFGWIF